MFDAIGRSWAPPQILHLPRRAAALTAATPHALWAATQNGQLLRIVLPSR